MVSSSSEENQLPSFVVCDVDYQLQQYATSITQCRKLLISVDNIQIQSVASGTKDPIDWQVNRQDRYPYTQHWEYAHSISPIVHLIEEQNLNNVF